MKRPTVTWRNWTPRPVSLRTFDTSSSDVVANRLNTIPVFTDAAPKITDEKKNKKISCRKRTARRAVLVEILSTAARLHARTSCTTDSQQVEVTGLEH